MIAEGELIVYLDKREKGIWETLSSSTVFNQQEQYTLVQNPYLILYLHSTNKVHIILQTESEVNEQSVFVKMEVSSSDPLTPSSLLEIRWKEGSVLNRQLLSIQALLRSDSVHCDVEEHSIVVDINVKQYTEDIRLFADLFETFCVLHLNGLLISNTSFFPYKIHLKISFVYVVAHLLFNQQSIEFAKQPLLNGAI